MGTPMEGFFDGAKFATPATFAGTHGVPVEALTSPTRPVPIDEGTHTGKVSEVTPTPAKTPFVQRGATPSAATQTRLLRLRLLSFPPVTPSLLCFRL